MHQNSTNQNSIDGVDASSTGEQAPYRRSQDIETIQAWMVSRVAETLQVEPCTVDIRQPFTSYGLESIAAFTLTGDLAEWLACDLPATLLWEHPTIETLARHLVVERAVSL